MKYLVYDLETDQINAASTKPPGYVSTKHPELLQGLLPVWHASPVNPELVVQAIRVLLVRIKDFPFAEVNSAVSQIVTRYRPNEFSIAALGASPKFIKWILKQKGYNTVAISVSKVKGDVEPTKEFIEYVERKLGKISNNNIALLDFVDSGESIVQIKTILSKLWKKGRVDAVALGVGAKFKPEGSYAPSIDFIVKNIPELTKGFQGVSYKNQLGRAKDMVDYATFPKPVKDGKVMEYQKAKYANAKPAFARAAELGPSDIVLDESFLEEAIQTANKDSDSDGDWSVIADEQSAQQLDTSEGAESEGEWTF